MYSKNVLPEIYELNSANQTGQDSFVEDLLGKMTLQEKVGQLYQANAPAEGVTPDFAEAIRQGRVGSVINQVSGENNLEVQRIAVEQSRLGIPLLIGRDVIHGFRTIFPIPLGQAASWNPELVKKAARISAVEASAVGVNWTFAPMIDISRDPRWGRVAESFGEDPVLASLMGAASVEGYQGSDLTAANSLAACAKHFCGYGASESGRDYNTTSIPETDLRNVHMRPFEAAVKAGAATFMTGFNDLNGVPASANEFLLSKVLREEWSYDGMVVSDWESIRQLIDHGYAEDERHAAIQAITAGVDMDMVSPCYPDYLVELVESGEIPMQVIDTCVANVLRCKQRLGLFDGKALNPVIAYAAEPAAEHLAVSRQAAIESCVLLKNDNAVLPVDLAACDSIAVIGPLADQPYEQLGTWIFDGQAEDGITPLQALRERLSENQTLNFSVGLEYSRSKDTAHFVEAVEAAEKSDVALVFVGEESILSGEAHSLADIGLPGAQVALIEALAATETPIVLVVLAGRPVVLEPVLDKVDAILYAWHPGSMAGPALADLLLGVESPVGKLPLCFPKATGQVPVYYAHKNTGRPASPEFVRHIDDIPVGAGQDSFGLRSFHLDVGYEPRFAFGYGLSYTEFAYSDFSMSSGQISADGSLELSVELTNTGDRAGTEVVQLYIRDRVGSVTRPVRELVDFQRIRLEAGESRRVNFSLSTDQLAFYGANMEFAAEPGKFDVWIGGSSLADLGGSFELLAN